MVSETEEETREKVRVLEQIGGRYGLKIHKGKSKIVVFNSSREIDRIEGIEIVEEFRYLGVKIENKRDMFRGQREDMIGKIIRMGKLADSVNG